MRRGTHTAADRHHADGGGGDPRHALPGLADPVQGVTVAQRHEPYCANRDRDRLRRDPAVRGRE